MPHLKRFSILSVNADCSLKSGIQNVILLPNKEVGLEKLPDRLSGNDTNSSNHMLSPQRIDQFIDFGDEGGDFALGGGIADA